jgi:carboxymethylenebutenolidase
MVSSRVAVATSAGSFDAYLAVPDVPNGGSVVVLQEIFGVNANIRAATDRLAADGFHAIAPDLFWRQRPNAELDPDSAQDREVATGLLKGLDQSLAVQDALGAAHFVRGLDGVNGKVGAVGYCLGGKLAYLLATQPEISAVSAYYGVGIQAALERMGDVRSPLLLHIAGSDHLCPSEAQEAITLAAQAKPDLVTIMLHPNVGHAFARIGSSARDPAAAARADAATLALLSQHLATK